MQIFDDQEFSNQSAMCIMELMQEEDRAVGHSAACMSLYRPVVGGAMSGFSSSSTHHVASPPRRRALAAVRCEVVPAPATVLVAGATGGVGQLLCAKLLERGYTVRAMSRSEEKTRQLLGDAPRLEVVYGDMRNPSTLSSAVEGVDAVCCCTGTTAFPSKRWDGGNNPEQTDYIGVKNLVDAAAARGGLKRFVLTTSAGVERSSQFPFFILNAFGVLKFKRMGEQVLEASGIPYTIVRPNRLTDGPYTSYDLNTLLKGISGERRSVKMSAKDDMVGETSRIAAAEAVLQALTSEAAENRKFAIESSKGEGPGQDPEKWKTLFEGVVANGKAP